ncbi:MAG: DsbA family oxidoreductase [Pseudomonadota bacterium]
MTFLDRPQLSIDMVSDVICPWCYIGFRSLDWAEMALSFNNSVAIRYRPYRLDPDTPAEGRDRRATLAGKFPDALQRTSMLEALEQSKADVGLQFDPERPERIPDTTNAHRLVRWAHESDKQHTAMNALFEAYWHHGEDVSKPGVLVAIAEEVGLDGREISARLQTREDEASVKEEAAAFRAAGFGGVPAFIVNEATAFTGALPKNQLLETIKSIAAEA